MKRDGNGLRINTRVKADGPPIPVICKFYADGFCIKNEQCRFLHQVPQNTSKEQNIPSNPPLSRPKPNHYIKQQQQQPSPANDQYVDFNDAFTSLFNSQPLFQQQQTQGNPNPNQLPAHFEFVKAAVTHSRPTTTYAQKAATSSTSTAPTISNNNVKSMSLCVYHIENTCRYAREQCKFTHGDLCEYCKKNILHPLDQSAREFHTQKCRETFELNQLAESLKSSKVSKAVKDNVDTNAMVNTEYECGICLESVLNKNRQFGLLQSCNHVFCLECIRGWRSSTGEFGERARGCPLCREVSLVLIPSPVMILDQSKKELMFEMYRKKLEKIPCKYFNYGDGECPFFNHCYYKHCDRDGHLIEKSKHRFKTGADGETEVIRDNTLSDFLFQPNS